jgi:hypothetical protein
VVGIGDTSVASREKDDAGEMGKPHVLLQAVQTRGRNKLASVVTGVPDRLEMV